MGRTQVYLGDEELALLERASQVTGASRSELIRRAVRESYGDATAEERLRGLTESAGSWKNRSFSGADYIDSLRSDLNKRLHSLDSQ